MRSEIPVYARSDDGGATFAPPAELSYLGHLPQIAAGRSALLVVGPEGFQRSRDGGASFEPAEARRFGDKLARAAASADGELFHVVGDSIEGGLHLHTSADAGASWTESASASARASGRW